MTNQYTKYQQRIKNLEIALDLERQRSWKYYKQNTLLMKLNWILCIILLVQSIVLMVVK